MCCFLKIALAVLGWGAFIVGTGAIAFLFIQKEYFANDELIAAVCTFTIGELWAIYIFIRRCCEDNAGTMITMFVWGGVFAISSIVLVVKGFQHSSGANSIIGGFGCAGSVMFLLLSKVFEMWENDEWYCCCQKPFEISNLRPRTYDVEEPKTKKYLMIEVE